METWLETPVSDIDRLQHCLNDLVSVLALPSVWSGKDPLEILETLLDALLRMLALDAVYGRLTEPMGGTVREIFRLGQLPIREAEHIRSALDELLACDTSSFYRAARLPLEERDLFCVSIHLGMQGELGMIVAASARQDFPLQTESLLLGVAANQASIALQESRILLEERRVAAELDKRVAERTAELAAANAELVREICERKLTEERLRVNEEALREAHWQVTRNEERWRSVFENSAIGVALTDLNGRFFGTNPVFQSMVGYGESELRELTFLDITDEKYRSINRELITELISGERGQFQIEKQYRTKDGDAVWVRNHVSVVPGTERVPRFLMAIVEDITDRKRSEEALRASEVRMRQVLDTIPTLAWCNLADGPNEFLNKAWVEYTGLSLEASNGWGWQVAFHPEDLPLVMDKWKAMIISGEGGDIEARIRRYDGVYRWFLIRAEPFHDEARNVVRWYGTSTDIDDRKRAENKLRRSEAFLAEGQHLARIGNFSWRVSTDEIVWSDQLCRIFEFEQGSVVTLERIATRVHPGDLAMLDDMIAQARRGAGDFEYEHRLLMPDGSVKYLHLVAHGMRDNRGELEYIGAVQDVTARRTSEEALAKARSELAQVARVMSLATLTASIAHEVNQPLSGIITNASTCLRMLSADPPNIDGARETARRTIRDGNRASDVIARLRALFTRRDVTLEPVNLNKAAQEVIALSLSDLKRNNVVLISDLAEDLPLVTGDRVQLQQVILNLIRNASDAMSAIHDRTRELLIKTWHQASEVCLSVRDAGNGFDPESADKLFDAFYTTKKEGMGIGLSVSRSIIENHQGRLLATANDGPGATFLFILPCNL